MPHFYPARLIIGLMLLGSLAACGAGANAFRLGGPPPASAPTSPDPLAAAQLSAGYVAPKSTIWDNFTSASNPNVTVQVNRYIWKAALEVLDFLPVESVDPFTGVIVTGYGTPPGSGKAYRATIFVQDGALDARSLHVALQTKGGGAVADETVRAVEDAILNRARELRIADAGY